MADDWWQDAPLVSASQQQGGGGDDWWKAAPMASGPSPSPASAPKEYSGYKFVPASGDERAHYLDDAGAWLLPEDMERKQGDLKRKASDEYAREGGAMHTMRSIINGGLLGWEPKLEAALLGGGQDRIDIERAKQAQFGQEHPFANFAGEMAGGGMTLGPVVGRVAKAVEAVPAGWAGRAAITGGAIGAPTGSVAEMADKGVGLDNAMEGAGKGLLTGAVAGPLVEGAGRGVAAAVGPWASEKARYLIDKGVPLTFGETVGGVVKRVEDLASRFPVAGSFIRGAQNASREEFNKLAVNDVLAPIGEKLSADTSAGHGAIAEAGEKISSAYSDLMPTLRGAYDDALKNSLAKIRNALPSAKRADFDDAVDRTIVSKVEQASGLSGDALRGAESDLRQEATGLMKSQASTFYDRKLGAALNDAREALFSMLDRYNPASAGERLRSINQSYSLLTRVEKAASMLGAKDGVFSASQLLNAVKATDQSIRHRAFARGEAKMQDLASAGEGVMRQGPTSGTAENLISMGGLEALMHGGVGIATGAQNVLAPIAASAAAYNPVSQNILRAMASAAPETRMQAANYLKALASRAAPIAAAEENVH